MTAQMLTQKFVRINKNYPEGYVGVKSFFTKYPYKTTPSGNRSNLVAVKELSDHEWRLTHGEYSKLVQVFFDVLTEYLFTGKPYKVPSHLGFWKLVKNKVVVQQDKKALTHELNPPNVFPWMNGYSYQVVWDKGRFRFKEIWLLKIKPQTKDKWYKWTKKDRTAIYRIDSKKGV